MLKSNIYKSLEQFPYAKNPQQHIIDASRDWIKTFRGKSKTDFDGDNFGLLTAYEFPFANEAQFRAACDLLNWFFLFDDITEIAEDPDFYAEQVLNVFRGEKTEENSKMIQATIEFLDRAKLVSTAQNYNCFVKSLIRYVNEVKNESKRRSKNIILDLKTYTVGRRLSIGTGVNFALHAAFLNLDFPDEFYEDPILLEAQNAMIDVEFMLNDIVSFYKEQKANNADVNVITVLMNERNISAQEAVEETEKIIKERIESYHKHRKMLKLDKLGEKFVDTFEYEIRGTAQWYKESLRYFNGSEKKIFFGE